MNNEVTNQENKYYAVTAKCGYVKGKCYALIEFGVKAISAKEAAEKARSIPRVKHNHRDAIYRVREITYKEFLEINKRNKQDLYLQVHSKSKQIIYFLTIPKRIANERNYIYKNEWIERIEFRKRTC